MNSAIDISTEEGAEHISAYLWRAFALCFLSNVAAGLISTLMGVYLPVAVKSLSPDTTPEELSRISGYISALYLVGWAIGGLTWGWIGDRVGRSRALAMAVGIFGLSTLAVCFTPSWESIVALRLVAGFCAGGILVLTPTLLSEIWPARSRSTFLGIDSIGFPVGIFSSGVVTHIASSWRSAFYIGLFPLILALLCLAILKESAQWKEASMSKSKTAHLTVDRGALLTGALIFSSMLIGLWGMFSWIATWIQSLPGVTEGPKQSGIGMMLLGAGGLTGGFISGWISNAIGVRRSMMICFSGCFVMSFLLFGLNHTFSPVIYAELAVLSMFFGISQGLLSIYIPQLFPYHIRGTATGFCFNIGRFVTAAAVFFVGVLVSTFGGYGNTLLAFAGIFIVGFVVVYFTKDRVK